MGSEAPLADHVSHSPEETQQVAAELARTLAPNSTVALHGNLGAGKTQFVRGLLMGLGGNPRTVSSPTYVLLNIYETGRMPLFHLDAYRIGGADDFEAIGFSELFEQGGVVVVEWAQRVAELMPAETIHVYLAPVGENVREIRIERVGA